MNDQFRFEELWRDISDIGKNAFYARKFAEMRNAVFYRFVDLGVFPKET